MCYFRERPINPLTLGGFDGLGEKFGRTVQIGANSKWHEQNRGQMMVPI